MIKKISGWLEAERNFLGAALGVSFLLRLAYVLKTGPVVMAPDAFDWMNTAWSVASGHGFGGSWRPPGYVLLLAGVHVTIPDLFTMDAATGQITEAILDVVCTFPRQTMCHTVESVR